MDDFVTAARRILKIGHLIILAGPKGALVLQLLDDTELEVAPLGAMRGANLGLNDGRRKGREGLWIVSQLVHDIVANLLQEAAYIFDGAALLNDPLEERLLALASIIVGQGKGALAHLGLMHSGVQGGDLLLGLSDLRTVMGIQWTSRSQVLAVVLGNRSPVGNAKVA